MPTTYGPELLGRVPSIPDDRNFPLEAFLDGPISKVRASLAALMTVHKNSATLKIWATIVTDLVDPVTPAPTPGPGPSPQPASAVLWADAHQLDQGQTGHCVGFGWAQFGNTLPVDDNFIDADGHSLYYIAKQIDGEPGAENGSSVHSGAKAMKQKGRLNAYAWATDIDTIKKWVVAQGPVTVGTDWTNDMFNPDANGFVRPTGGVAGGHCFVIVGYDPNIDVFTFQNSWGSGWADNGYFRMHAADFALLFKNQGEACTAVELAA